CNPWSAILVFAPARHAVVSTRRFATGHRRRLRSTLEHGHFATAQLAAGASQFNSRHTMFSSRKSMWTAVLLALVISSPAFVYYVLFDHRSEPFCHKALMLGVLNYFEEEKTDILPNIDGHSAPSIAVLEKDLGDDPEWKQKYRYLPGLKKGDPGDLVLMY